MMTRSVSVGFAMALWWAAVQAEPQLDPSSEALTIPEQIQTDTTESAAFYAETAIKSSTGASGDGVTAELAQIRGLIEPVNEATLSSELLARIVEFPFREGEHFKAKDVLVRFDCSRLGAELNAARAAYTAGKKKYENNAELARYNAAATLEVEVSKAEASEALAQMNARGAMLNGCIVRAPWSGRVVETKAHKHETVAPGQELLSIVDDSKLEVELIVPSKWLGWVTKETRFRFRVDETGNDYAGKVSQVGARVEPVSQTVRLTAVMEGEKKGLLAGMSGTAHFDVPMAGSP